MSEAQGSGQKILIFKNRKYLQVLSSKICKVFIKNSRPFPETPLYTVRNAFRYTLINGLDSICKPDMAMFHQSSAILLHFELVEVPKHYTILKMLFGLDLRAAWININSLGSTAKLHTTTLVTTCCDHVGWYRSTNMADAILDPAPVDENQVLQRR